MPCDQGGVAVPAVVVAGGLGDRAAQREPVDPAPHQAQGGRHEGEGGRPGDDHDDGGGQPHATDEVQPAGVEAQHGHRDGDGGHDDGAPAGGGGTAGRVDRVVPVEEVLAEAGGEEERVVDAHAEADHGGQGGGGGREADDARDDADDAEAHADADHRGEQGQQGGGDAAEGEQEDQQGHEDARRLAGPVVGRRPDDLVQVSAVRDLHAGGAGRGGGRVERAGVLVPEGLDLPVEGHRGVGGTAVRAGHDRGGGGDVGHPREAGRALVEGLAVPGQGAGVHVEDHASVGVPDPGGGRGQQIGAGTGLRAGEGDLVAVDRGGEPAAEHRAGQQQEPGRDHPDGVAGAEAAEAAEAARSAEGECTTPPGSVRADTKHLGRKCQG